MQCNPNPWGKESAWLVSMTDTTWVGIDDNKTRNSIFNIFPNPSNTIITISTITNLAGETNISIFNITGAKATQGKFINQNRIVMDVSNLPKGMYLLKLQNMYGIECRKLVIN